MGRGRGRREGGKGVGSEEGGGEEGGRRKEGEMDRRELGMRHFCYRQRGEGGSKRGGKIMSCVRMKGASGVSLTDHSPITVPQTQGSWEVFRGGL